MEPRGTVSDWKDQVMTGRKHTPQAWKGQERFLQQLLSLPGMMLVIFFWLIPLIILAVSSFFTNIPGGGYVREFTLDNYAKILSDPFYLIVLFRTAIIAVIVTILAIFISYPVAYKLARIDPERANFFLILIIVPFLTAVIFRTFGLIYVLGNKGVINSFLSQIGTHPIKLIWNKTGVIIGFLNVLLPYMILSLYSSIMQVDRSLEEAAQTLGASRVKATWYVILPLITPGIATGAIFVFAIAMGTFEVPSILGGMKEMVISMLIQQNVALINFPLASALSLILLIIVVGALSLFTRVMGGRLEL
jgi:ABC-type spermidine/putrescine transport system permease subunit I